MCVVTARATFHGHELTDIPVLNPGDWFGKAWLIEIGGSYSPLFLVVEADSIRTPSTNWPTTTSTDTTLLCRMRISATTTRTTATTVPAVKCWTWITCLFTDRKERLPLSLPLFRWRRSARRSA